MSLILFLASDAPLETVSNPHVTREIIIDMNTGAVNDGGFDDDFAIYDMDIRLGPDESLMDHRVVIECDLTLGRAKRILTYIRDQMENNEEIELWSVWLGDYDQRICYYDAHINELTPEDLLEIACLPIRETPMRHHCVRIHK